MSRKFLMLALAAAVAVLAQPVTPSFAQSAQDAKAKSKSTSSAKRGGYSYNQADSINTYGDSRGKFGSANSLRDPNIDRQTNFGPFDHGFFFESGTGPGQHGGNAPFLH
jgi:hypothetical protein